MSEPMTGDRLQHIDSALHAIPTPPWQWIGDRRTGALLVTGHSGWLYLLGAERPLDSAGEPAEDADGV
ncbi:hypothetical protein, partial [Nonomuraea sp. NPDC049784]|uniref:hypothetical protein n=1 Tax=Nonomuraea sp. NPDC049784 TaxID=3154361 RepID=UPI0033EBC2C9